MTSSTAAWKPSPGRHQANIGPSLGRAIKARKLKGSPAPNTKRSNLPERDFYSFRYNFKPGAFDSTRPAIIEIKKGEENTQVFAEFPSKELNEVCTYNGSEQPAKDVDCILIYDEDTGQFTLEKLDSFVLLKHVGKKAVAPSVPSPSIGTSRKDKRKRDDDDDDDELERLLLADGADRETDIVNRSQKYRKEEEEEGDEGDDADIPLRVQLSQRPSAGLPAPIANGASRLITPLPKSKSRDSNAHATLPSNLLSASTSTPTITPLAPTPPKPKLASTKPTKKTKTAAAPAIPVSTTPMASNASSMRYDIVKPLRKVQAATSTSRKPAPVPVPPDPPKPKPPLELSLPGKQSGFVPPPAPPDSSSATRIFPTTATNTITDPPGVSATITMEEVLGEEEEEEDWEPVTAATSTSVAATSGHAQTHSSSQQPDYDLQLERDIFGEGFGEEADADAEEVEGGAEEEEIDVNAFEAELNDFFGDDGEGDEDEDMEDAMQEVAGGDNSRQPISLNKLASGMAEGMDSEDDFSSSESESD